MDNILKFPPTTLCGKTVPKNAFYGRSNDSGLREFLTREFENIIWLYKLAPATLNVTDGERVHEIDVFLCRMKGNYYSVHPFGAMDGLLPRHTLFVIEYGGKFDFLMHHKEMDIVRGDQKWTHGNTELKRDMHLETDVLRIEGQSMDTVYSSLLSQISGLQATDDTEYKEQAELRKQLDVLQKQVAAIQMRIRAEKQFNRQMELNAEARLLKKEIVTITKKINKKTNIQ